MVKLIWTRDGLVPPYGVINFGLLSGGTLPFTEYNVDVSSTGCYGTHLKLFSREVLKINL